jgi:hypothetical protein
MKEDTMRLKKFRFAMLSLIFAFSLLTVGCSKLTKANYDRLKVGQNYDEVVKILGKADKCSSTFAIMDCRWGDDEKFIKVKFAGNKVIIFSSKGL